MPPSECVLYVTDDCSLCDEALDMLLNEGVLGSVILSTIDIAMDDAMVQTYGERIPVLEAGGKSLDWPFTATDAASLIARATTQK